MCLLPLAALAMEGGPGLGRAGWLGLAVAMAGVAGGGQDAVHASSFDRIH